MPISYEIIHTKRLVLAIASGTLNDADVFGYQRTAWSDPAIADYHEFIDTTAVETIVAPSPERVKALADLAADMDQQTQPTKLAVVATSNVAFGLGRMFATWRELNPKSRKAVSIFRTRAEALAWLGVTLE